MALVHTDPYMDPVTYRPAAKIPSKPGCSAQKQLAHACLKPLLPPALLGCGLAGTVLDAIPVAYMFSSFVSPSPRPSASYAKGDDVAVP